jgi:enoyl-CoA hydratase
MNEAIRVERDGAVATVTIDREDRRNALDHHAVNGLREAISDLSREDVAVMVLTGAGTKSFCAGDDIKAYKDRSAEESRQHFERGLKLMTELAEMPCLTVAAIEGYCMGGGLELALSCDLRFASSEAVFAVPEVRKLKANPTWGGLTNLPAAIGLPKAKRMIFLGERWDADTAFAAGLLDRVEAAGGVLAAAQAEAQSFAEDTDAAVVRDAKAILHAAAHGGKSAHALINLLAERAQPFQGA